MPFIKPIYSTDTAKVWQDTKKTSKLTLQHVKSTYVLLFPCRYRIILSTIGYTIASANSKVEIERLWYFAIRYVDSISNEARYLSAFHLLYQTLRELPEIIEYSEPTLEINEDLKEINFEKKIIRRRLRSFSSLVHIEYIKGPGFEDEEEEEEINLSPSEKMTSMSMNMNTDIILSSSPTHHSIDPIPFPSSISSIQSEPLTSDITPHYFSLFLIKEDYTSDQHQLIIDEEERMKTFQFKEPNLTTRSMVDSFNDTFSLSKKERTKVIKLLGYLKKVPSHVRGKGIIVRAIRDQSQDHWGKLEFQRGDLFLAFPDCPTGDFMWCLGVSPTYREGVFYRYGFAIALTLDKMVDTLHSIDGFKPSLYYDDLSFLNEKSSRQHENSNLSGWLWKKGFWGIWKDWKRRWFILDIQRGKIFYYEEPKSQHDLPSPKPPSLQNSNSLPSLRDAPPPRKPSGKGNRDLSDIKGYIDLNEITTVHESFYPGSRKKKGSWPFEIHTYDRVWMLCAYQERQMLSWIDKINSIVLQNCVFRASNSLKRIHTSPSANSIYHHPARSINYTEDYDPLSTYTPGISKPENEQTFGPISSFNPKDDFELFGAPDGEEITNKYSILKDLDIFLGYRQPPAVEYIFVEPYLNYSSGNVQLSANPYGHAVIRYTLPNTGEQIVMNIVGLANQEMVNFLPPEEYLFSTNFDIKIGNEQGSIYNRNFASIRIQRVPPEKVLAMHQYYVDLKKRSHREKALYNIAVGPILNLVGKTTYGNCAFYCSQGLRQAGVMHIKGVGSMLPKAIWVDLYEALKCQNQNEAITPNISVVYYKRIQHAKRFYGLDEDYTGWGRPSEKFTHGPKYENLEQYADAIVYVPSNSKTAFIKSSSKSSLSLSRLQSKLNSHLLADGSMAPHLEFDLSGHIEPRILFNEYFSKRIYTSTLKPFQLSSSLDTPSQQISLLTCGNPIWNNSWLVQEGKLFKSMRSSPSRKTEWIELPSPPNSLLSSSSSSIISPQVDEANGEVKKEEDKANGGMEERDHGKGNYDWIAAGEDGKCWVIYGGALLLLDPLSHPQWKRITPPSSASSNPIPLSHVSINDNDNGVWVIDIEGNVYSSLVSQTLSISPFYQANVEADWYHHAMAPKLKHISIGGNKEVWGVNEHNEVYRRIVFQSQAVSSERWIKLHGTCLNYVSVLNKDEVWGLDKEGNVYIWSKDSSSSPSISAGLSTPKKNDSKSEDEEELDYEHINVGQSERNILLTMDDCMQNMSWQLLGNSMPIRTICVTSSGVLGIGDDKSVIYKLSKHRLLVTSTNSARKIWDDRKLNAFPYHLGFWRPLPPNGFYCLGYIAERSHLEYPSTETIIVREVGKQEGDIDILASPVGFRKVWSASSAFGHCSVWHPVPPSEQYVSLGEVVMPYLNVKPSVHSVKCVHKNFVSISKPYSHRKKHGYLWSSKGASMDKDFSVWLVQPALKSIYCNTFVSTVGNLPPQNNRTMCLKISVEPE